MKKASIDQKQLMALASKLRIIAHPLRITIIDMLEENKKLNVTQIYTKLKIEQATASNHLILMKKHGVLISKKNGKEILYSVKEGFIKKLNSCISNCEL